MDTKSKSSKIFGRLVSALLIAAVATVLLLYGNSAYYRMGSYLAAPEEQSAFIQSLYNYSYALYWKGEQRAQNDIQLSPVELFFPDAEGILGESSEGEETQKRNMQELENRVFYQMLEAYEEFQGAWENWDYYVYDQDRDSLYGRGRAELKALAQGAQSAEDAEVLERKYDYYIQFLFDDTGKVSVPVLYGADADSVYMALQNYDIEGMLLDYLSEREALTGSMEGPKNFSFTFAIPAGAALANSTFSEPVVDQVIIMRSIGMDVGGLLAFLFAALLGFVMMARRSGEFLHRWWAKLPLEVAVVTPFLAWWAYVEPLLSWMVRYFSGRFLAVDGSALLGFLGVIVIWGGICLALGAVFISALSLAQIRVMGPKAFLLERSLILRMFHWMREQWRKMADRVKGRCRRIADWFTDLNLRDGKNRALVRILLLNLVAICLLCLLNPAGLGMAGALLYTIVAYTVARRRMKKIRGDYRALLDATTEMAKGNLHVPLDEDLGAFDPIKTELKEVQESFGAAVEAEVRSQKMKAELITNVSHDLKTPLTSIITYVDLLKDESISPAERQSYIDTLAQKSQRLKELINDLFEVSKASSNTMVFYPSAMNIVSLIKQVENEWQDAYAEAGLALHNRFAAENLPVYLDGEKTSRIFENLFNNAWKYSLAGTRVFVEAEAAEDEVRVSIKNVSREALDFDDELITERFVRGDSSRNTEGSGLGLAIVKGFTENQGGRFLIETEGDLFRAIVTFPLWVASQEPAAEENGEAVEGS